MARLTGVQVLATGACAPEEVITNQDLAELGYDEEWIVKRTGIQARRRAAADQATSDLAAEAARRCLARAGVEPRDVDLIVLATMTPDHPTPSTACLVQQKLGGGAAAMDVNAACAGFMYALTTAMQFVKSGTARNALAIGADTMSRIVNPEDRKTFPLFGDGGGAVLLGPGGEDQGLVAFTLGADGRGSQLLIQPGGGSREPLTTESLLLGRQYIQMDGRVVFKWAVRLIRETTRDVLRHAQLELGDLDWIVMHQANQRIIDAAAADLGVPLDRVLVNVDRYGNTSAGTIPLVLDEAHAAGKFRPGDKILVIGFGAGLAWGSAILQW